MESTSHHNDSDSLLGHASPGPPSSVDAATRHQASDAFGLQLTATDSIGQFILSDDESVGDVDLPQLPPLLSYCSFVRLGCAFGKGPFAVVVVNFIAFEVNVKAGYFGHSRFWPFTSWHGCLLVTVWFLTALWFYRCSKVVEKDLQSMDHHHYQPGRILEDDNAPAAVQNHEHVFGHASRKIDALFHSPNAATSSLVNLSLVLCALFLCGAVFLGTGLVWGQQYHTTCTERIHHNATANETTLSEIESYPKDVQNWIVKQTNFGGSPSEMQPFNDDDRERGEDAVLHHKDSGGDEAYPFPTAHSSDSGVIASMTDGTVFLAGRPVGNTTDNGKYLVLMEIPGTGGPPKYHLNIRNPRMFIPVAETASKNADGNWVAAQYCFTASNQEATERKKSRPSLDSDSMIQSTPLYCVTAKAAGNKGDFDIPKAMLVWNDNVLNGGSVNAASTGKEILVARAGLAPVGLEGFSVLCQEVLAVNPETMKIKGVYLRFCMRNPVQLFCAHNSILAMLLSGYWMIVREGVPAGVAPILLAVVSSIRLFSEEGESGLARMSLTLGTMFFHGVLACGNIRFLPTWIGRSMYTWALYSWIISFIIVDWFFEMGRIGYMATVYLCLSSIFLNHPIAHVIGYSYVLMGIWSFILFPFFGDHEHCRPRYCGHLGYGTLHILAGIGIIGLSCCLSNNRRYFVAACRPIARAWRIVFYGSPSKKPE